MCLSDSPIRSGGGEGGPVEELLRVFNIYGSVSVRTSTQKKDGGGDKKKNTLLHSRTKRKEREKGRNE